MSIFFDEKKQTFHLCNNEISYIMAVLPNGQMGQLYFGKHIHPERDYSQIGRASCRERVWYLV